MDPSLVWWVGFGAGFFMGSLFGGLAIFIYLRSKGDVKGLQRRVCELRRINQDLEWRLYRGDRNA